VQPGRAANVGQTKISWTWYVDDAARLVPGYTYNPWWGCLRVSEECAHCYADQQARRYGFNGTARPLIWGPSKTTPRHLFGDAHWLEPLKWEREATAAGELRRVFCASFADVFEDHPQVVAARERLWWLIEQTPHLLWLLLTKRPENIAAMLPVAWLNTPRENVWLGTSIGLQKWLLPRWSALASVPAVVHFVSAEPLLGPLDLQPIYAAGEQAIASPVVDWLIVGGESGGPKARRLVESCCKVSRKVARTTSDVAACESCAGTGWRPKADGHEWVRALRDQARRRNIALHFKQWGGPYDHAAGRLLDGREWQESPQPVSIQEACARADAHLARMGASTAVLEAPEQAA
jgi:protein gp37